MNIFFVDKNPSVAAQALVDKHVVKMILESCQLLSTAHRVLDGHKLTIIKSDSPRKSHIWTLNDERNDVLYAATHINHPSSIWVRQSNLHYTWLYWHLVELCNEYTYRYKKKHKCEKLLIPLLSLPDSIPLTDNLVQPPPAMDDKYVISQDSVINYRNYYKVGKAHIHSWRARNPPEWIINK
jgi:hypothetical protein